MYILTGIFGASALFLQTYGKLMALIILLVVMLILPVTLVIFYKKKETYEKR